MKSSGTLSILLFILIGYVNCVSDIFSTNANRKLLSLSEEALKCLNKSRDLYRKNAALESYFEILDTNPIWNMNETQPLCSIPSVEGDLVRCDARRLPKSFLNAERMKTICENVEGVYFEMDIEISTRAGEEAPSTPKKVIKNIPLCASSKDCTEEYRGVILDLPLFDEFATPTATYDITPSLSTCDERGKDLFFVKINKNGAIQTMTCKQLVKRRNKMKKDPCEKKWSPSGQPAVAKLVCPATCQQEICTENPSSEFVKNIPTSAVKTCQWLANQSKEKKEKLCGSNGRKFYRADGFPSVPSAYSACPETCGAVL